MWLCLFGPALFDLFIPSSRTQNPERPRKTDRVPDGGTEQHRAAVGPHREAELRSHRGRLACVRVHPHVHVSRSQDSSEAAWTSTRTHTHPLQCVFSPGVVAQQFSFTTAAVSSQLEGICGLHWSCVIHPGPLRLQL